MPKATVPFRSLYYGILDLVLSDSLKGCTKLAAILGNEAQGNAGDT